MTLEQGFENSIRSQLNTKFVGREILFFPSLTSTMDVARKAAREGAVEGTAVMARTQTAGRGRLGRVWLSPQGSLAISVILKPSLVALPRLIMVASLAVVRTIKKVANLEAHIKWPNDVLIKGKKVCGILIENEVTGNQVDFAIIGIGININFNPTAFPEISDIATSLSNELGKEISQIEFTSVLLYDLEQLYLEAQASTATAIYEEWRDHLETLGKWIQVKAGDTIEEGMAETVTENGNLILRRADGSLAEVVAGDVTVIRK